MSSRSYVLNISWAQAYHSAFNEDLDVRQVGNMSILPIKTKIRGPAQLGTCCAPNVILVRILTSCDIWIANGEEADIIDETLDLFRANSLFRNFEIKGPADRLLIVLILYVSDCLAKIGTAKTVPTQIEASKLLNTLSVDNFAIPGDAMFVLNSHYAPPSSRQDAGMYTALPVNVH
jgi:actin related protein 2/3 complex subunit 3